MKEIMDEAQIARTLKRLAHEIIESHPDLDKLLLVGIKTRGEAIAQRLKRNIRILTGVEVETVSFDFHEYRDDVISENASPLPSEVIDRIVILVDDVLFEGRTIRAAMDGVMHRGRANKIEAAVLVDRGHRKLPIRADYVGKNIPTSINEKVAVHLKEYDDEDKVIIVD